MLSISNITSFLIGMVMVFGVPVIIGVSMLLRKRKSRLVWYAALLTLKPLFTTPIWYLIFINNLDKNGVGVLMMLPGAGVTIVLAWAYASVFKDPITSGQARKLLALDCVRWITSGVWALLAVASNSSNSGLSVVICGIVIAALALPTVFAFAALRYGWEATGRIADSPLEDIMQRR